MTVVMLTKRTVMEIKCKNDVRLTEAAPNYFLGSKQASILIFICPKHNVTYFAFNFILSYIFRVFSLLIKYVSLINILLRHRPLHWGMLLFILKRLLGHYLLWGLMLFLLAYLLLNLVV